MARRFGIKERGKEQRKRKPVYLMIAEGRNKTEINYFSNFQDQDRKYNLKILKAGNNTDVESLYKTIDGKWEELGLSVSDGDRAFIVFDLDNDETKIKKAETIRKSNHNQGICFIVSNPSFEVWLLLHFKRTSKYYTDGRTVITDLKKYIPDYEKNKDVFSKCEDNIEDAMDNALKLKAYFEGESYSWWNCNPMTDVADLMKYLLDN